MRLMIDDAVWGYKEIFSMFGDITTLPGRLITRESLLECEILIVRSRTKIDKELLDGTKVKFVGSTVAGLDHIDEVYLRESNIFFASATEILLISSAIELFLSKFNMTVILSNSYFELNLFIRGLIYMSIFFINCLNFSYKDIN